jgi:hypothetical protein
MPRRESLFDIGTPDDTPLQIKTIHANTFGNLVANVKSAVSDVVAYLSGDQLAVNRLYA